MSHERAFDNEERTLDLSATAGASGDALLLIDAEFPDGYLDDLDDRTDEAEVIQQRVYDLLLDLGLSPDRLKVELRGTGWGAQSTEDYTEET